VLDLTFLRFGSKEFSNHSIYSNWHLISDHVPLTVTIPIVEEHIQTKKCTIVKDSEEEKTFINEVIKAIKYIDTSNLSDVISLKSAVYIFAHYLDIIWEKNSKIVNITKHLKSWWDMNCSRNLEKYRSSKCIED